MLLLSMTPMTPPTVLNTLSKVNFLMAKQAFDKPAREAMNSPQKKITEHISNPIHAALVKRQVKGPQQANPCLSLSTPDPQHLHDQHNSPEGDQFKDSCEASKQLRAPAWGFGLIIKRKEGTK